MLHQRKKQRKITLEALIALYAAWSGDVKITAEDKSTADIITFLTTHKNDPEFAIVTQQFHQYITSVSGKHSLRYQRIPLFLDMYYVTETNEFKKLIIAVTEFLPKKTWAETVNDIWGSLKQTAAHFTKHPIPAYVGTLTLLSYQAKYMPSLNPSYFETHYPLINQKNVIVCMSDTPGFGDYGCTFNVMKYVRHLGYKGQFQLLYENAEKIKLLFGMNHLSGFDNDSENNIQFIHMNTYSNIKENNSAHLGFTVVQGSDLCSLQILNASMYVRFSSFHYPTYFETSDKYKDQLSEQHNVLSNSKSFFVIPPPSYDNVKKFLHSEQGQKVLNEIPALNMFITGLENQQFNLLPLYGYSFKFPLNNHLAEHGGASPKNMIQTLAGARYAQLNGQGNFSKPLIIAVFDDYHLHAKKLLSLLSQDNWERYEREDAPHDREVLKDLGFPNCLRIAHIKDNDTSEIIANLQPNEMLLLTLPRLPKVLFSGIYFYQGENAWLKILEGAGTEHEAIMTGKPFLRCAPTSYFATSQSSNWHSDLTLLADEKLQKTLNIFYHPIEGYCGSICEDAKPHTLTSLKIFSTRHLYQILGQFIIDSQNPNSEFSIFFAALREHALLEENDRVRTALKIVESTLAKSNKI